jgi:cellulose synthase (UDP-forming)
VLPTPPNDRERQIYIQRRLVPLMLISAISFTCIMISQIKFSLQHPALFIFLPLVSFTLGYYLISLWVNFGTRDFDLEKHDAFITSWWATVRKQDIPSVDVFLPICGEPYELLANTWHFVKELQYRGKLTVYVLDDKDNDRRLRTLAERYGFTYLSRDDKGVNKKAGNLLHGYENSTGDHILVFDADFTPRDNMLNEMVPYMEANSEGSNKLGIIQTPQYFRSANDHMNWLERGAGAVQEFFYRVVQTSRHQRNAAICVGTNALYRRKALDSNGGPTQIGHSEDVHTGFDLRRNGWGLEYIPVALATGVCPSVRSSFLTQQYRWCMGSMSLLGSKKFWQTKMSLRSRAGYLSGFCYYMHTAIMTFVAPLIPLTLMLFFPGLIRLENYILIVPSLAYTLVVFPLWHRNKFGISAMAVKMIYGWAHVFALVDIMRGKRKAWQPTGNGRTTRGVLDKHFHVGSICWSLATAVIWVGLGIHYMFTAGRWYDFAPITTSGLVFMSTVAVTIGVTKETLLPATDVPEELVAEA